MQSLAQVLGPNAQIQFTTTGPATQTFTFNLNPNQPLNQPPNQNPVQGAAANPATPPGNVNPQEILNSILGNPQSLLQRLFSSMGMVGNPGDYAFGREFDDIVTQLMEQSGGNAPPPAPEDAIKGLPRIEVGKEKSEGMPCSICQEPFEIGTKVPKLPCGHIFHEGWLRRGMSCPNFADALPFPRVQRSLAQSERNLPDLPIPTRSGTTKRIFFRRYGDLDFGICRRRTIKRRNLATVTKEEETTQTDRC